MPQKPEIIKDRSWLVDDMQKKTNKQTKYPFHNAAQVNHKKKLFKSEELAVRVVSLHPKKLENGLLFHFNLLIGFTYIFYAKKLKKHLITARRIIVPFTFYSFLFYTFFK